MAMNTKTTIWGIGPIATANVNSATLRSFASTTIYVPETTSRTFRSAIVELNWSDVSITAASITAILGGLTVNATRTTDATSGTYTNSGEDTNAVVQLDFTAGVQANFGAGASQTMQFDVTITGIVTNNVSATLKLTYDYDDSAATLCKTAMIPLESLITNLATSLGSIGTNQIPILTGASGIIKEASPVIRDYFFVVSGNETIQGGTADVTLNVALDSEAATPFGLIERALGSDKYFRNVWSRKADIGTLNHTITHDFKAYCSTTSHFHMCVLLVVTYEFDRATSTAALNSIQVPFNVPQQGATAVADAQVIRIPIDIQEPDTLALVQSGVEFHWSLSGAMALGTTNYITFKMGAQTARSYTSNIASGSLCGGLTAIQRIDSGSAGGAGMTMGAGQRYVDVYVYTGAQRAVSGISGILYLNYTSGASATTIDRHNKTVYNNIAKTLFTLATQYTEIAARPFTYIAATAYWLQCAGVWTWNNVVGTTATLWTNLYVENLANDGVLGVGDGWERVSNWETMAMAETGSYGVGQCSLPAWKRHPTDPKQGARTITASRKFRYMSPRSSMAIQTMVTFHALTFTASGAVSGYVGTGAVTVKVHDDASGEHLYTVTAAVGGAYTATIYDKNRDHFSEVFEDATHVGRSAKWKAT